MPRLTKVMPRGRKEVVMIDGYSADTAEFPAIDVFIAGDPEGNSITTGPILKIKYYAGGAIREFEDADKIYRFPPRPPGRPRRQDF